MIPCGAYVVDILQANSAEATAAVKCVPDLCDLEDAYICLHPLYSAFRWIILSFETAALLPMVNAYGHLFTNSVVAFMVVIGMGYASILSDIRLLIFLEL